MNKYIIAWDLGATKCTAGLVAYDTATHVFTCEKQITLKLAQTSSLANMIEQIEAGLKLSMGDADAVCIGAAGQYQNGELILEGVYPYPMPFAQLAKQRNWPAYAVLHDYAPVVCATFTPYMEHAANLKRLNACAINPYGRRVAAGIGTGLGLKDGVLLESGDFWLGKNEIGHIGIPTPPAADAGALQCHHELMRFLQTTDSVKPATFEKILSGQGTARLHQFFYGSSTSPEDIGKKMRAGLLPELTDTFAWYAGLFVGTVQLIFMPEGGVWLTGGVALNHLEVFDSPKFLAGIHASPAYLAQRETWPIGILCNLEHALIGCGYYAVKRLLS